MTEASEINRDEIINATGKTLEQWFSELDQKGFQCIHWKQQLNTLSQEYQVDRLWAERIVEAYCSECGLPWKDQANEQFKVIVSKTFHHPYQQVKQLAEDWFETEQRAKAMHGNMNGGSKRYKWITDDSEVALTLEKLNAEKTRVILAHQDLNSTTDVDIMRNFWKAQLPGMIETL